MLALVVLAISLAGHAAGSDLLPTSFGLFLALLLTITLSRVVVMRARSFAWLLGFVVALQMLLHIVFVIAGGGAHTGASHGSLIPSGAGILGHLLAALVAVPVLKYGDDLLDRWAYLLSQVFGSLEFACTHIASPSRLAQAPHSLVISSVVLNFSPRRGPPVLGS